MKLSYVLLSAVVFFVRLSSVSAAGPIIFDWIRGRHRRRRSHTKDKIDWITNKARKRHHKADVHDAVWARRHATSVQDRASSKLDGLALSTCIVDSGAAFFYLQQMAMSIVASSEDCLSKFHKHYRTEEERHYKEHLDHVSCAADVAGVVQAFFNSASYITGIIPTCTLNENVPASCTAAITSFIGDLSETIQGWTSSVTTCGQLNNRYAKEFDKNGVPDAGTVAVLSAGPYMPPDTSTNSSQGRRLRTANSKLGRRLQSANSTQGRRLGHGHNVGLTAPTPVSAAWCYVDIGSTPVYLAQAGNNLAAAVSDCKIQQTPAERADCAVDVAGAIASLMDVVGYIGGAASLCSGSINLDALCAGDVGTIGNGMFGLASASAALKSSCRSVVTPAHKRKLYNSAENSTVESKVFEKVLRMKSDVSKATRLV